MRDPDNADSYEVILDPVRKATMPAEVDGFLETRLSPPEQSKLRQIMNGGPE